MKKLLSLAAIAALLSGCMMFQGLDQEPDTEKQDVPPVEEERQPEPEKPEQEKPQPQPEQPQPEEAVPEYQPQDFPAPEGGLDGSFHRGSMMPGLDPYRDPDATSPNRGYYFFHPQRIEVKKEFKIEKAPEEQPKKIKKVEEEPKPGFEK